MNTLRRILLPLLLLLTPVAASSQSLTLPAMTPLAFRGAPALLPQPFAINPRQFLAQATPVVAPPVTVTTVAALPSLWLPVSFGPSKSYTLGINKSLNGTYADLTRDFKNGMWAAGPGIETEQVWHKNSTSGAYHEWAYLGLENLYTMGDTTAGGGNGKGIFAAHIGVKLPTLILEGIGKLSSHDIQAELPPWGQLINNIVSIEGGMGYRVFGISQSMANQGILKYTWDLGLQLNIPVATLMKGIGVAGSW